MWKLFLVFVLGFAVGVGCCAYLRDKRKCKYSPVMNFPDANSDSVAIGTTWKVVGHSHDTFSFAKTNYVYIGGESNAMTFSEGKATWDYVKSVPDTNRYWCFFFRYNKGETFSTGYWGCSANGLPSMCQIKKGIQKYFTKSHYDKKSIIITGIYEFKDSADYKSIGCPGYTRDVE